MGIKNVYVDDAGDEVSVAWHDDSRQVSLGTVDYTTLIPQDEITTFRDFINDELDRIEAEIEKGLADNYPNLDD